MQSWILHFFDYFNTIILIYFIVTNVMYSILMVLSLYSVTLHSKAAGAMSYKESIDLPTTPPVALIVPAFNEQDAIVQTVLSLMDLDYPEKEIIVVDDGSTDDTADRLIDYFGLQKVDFIYRESIPAKRPFAFYYSPDQPQLLLVSKENGGKADALNVGVNIARSPYFCTVDADSLIEKDALIRLMVPVLQAPENTLVSGGVVRIVNGCAMEDGKVSRIDLPKSWIERCQVVEYIRTFLFGRPGWNFLNATFICSGAFCLLHREAAALVGGFSTDTVTEDTDIIAKLHSFQRTKKWKYRMIFTTDPICWTEAPHNLSMLARQRRRWHLGLMQTVMKHNKMLFDPHYKMIGMLSMPFHAYIEGIGCVVEALGLFLVPFSFLIGAMPLSLFLLIMFLAIGYGTLLSMGSVLLEESTLRRYPSVRHVLTLSLYAVIENLGYRQIISIFRAQGVLKYFTGRRKWEVVEHKGVPMAVGNADA